MDEATNQIMNQGPVQGQVGTNYGAITNIFGAPGTSAPLFPPPERVWNVPYRQNPYKT